MNNIKKNVINLRIFTMLMTICSFAMCFIACNNGTTQKPEQNPQPVIDKDAVDLASTQELSLESYSYEVKCAVPDKSGESWTAELTFDEEDDFSGETAFFADFAYVYPTKGTRGGVLNLCVLDSLDGSQRSGKLTVTYSGGSKIEVKLVQEAASTNEIEGGAGGRKNRKIGYGYDAFKGYLSDKCIKNPIFRIAQLEDEIETEDGSKARIVYADESSSITHRDESGTNIAELESSLNASVNASVNFGGFSSELESTFEKKDKSNDNYQFAWSDTMVTTHTASVEGSSSLLSSLDVLTMDAYKAINNVKYDKNNDEWVPSTSYNDFKKVIKDFGTHVVVGGVLGGKMHVDMAADTSHIEGSYEVTAMIKAGYEGSVFSGDAKVNGSYKDTLTSDSDAFKFNANVTGGSKDEKKVLNSQLKERKVEADTVTEWMNSLSEIENCVLMDFVDEDSLIPIYELVDTDLEGGEERYEAFKEYFETKMFTDFTVKKQSSYVSNAPAKVEVPSDWDKDGSLIKDVYNDGTLCARITNEYIPQLNVSKRVTVVYPASNNKVYYNLGYFVGDDTHRPHSVSWQGDIPVLSEKLNDSKDFGAVSTVYIKALNLSGIEPDYLPDETEPFSTEIRDYKLEAGQNGSYNLVKILGNIYTRDYWHGEYFADGRTYLSNSVYYDYGSPVIESIRYCAYASDFIYWDLYHSAYGGGFAPTGWDIPSEDSGNALLSAVNNIVGTLPNGSKAGMFLEGGVLGLNLKLGVNVRRVNDKYNYDSCNLTLGNKTQKEKKPWEHNILKISTSSGNVIAEKKIPDPDANIYEPKEDYYYPVILSKSCQ